MMTACFEAPGPAGGRSLSGEPEDFDPAAIGPDTSGIDKAAPHVDNILPAFKQGQDRCDRQQ